MAGLSTITVTATMDLSILNEEEHEPIPPDPPDEPGAPGTARTVVGSFDVSATYDAKSIRLAYGKPTNLLRGDGDAFAAPDNIEADKFVAMLRKMRPFSGGQPYTTLPFAKPSGSGAVYLLSEATYCQIGNFGDSLRPGDVLTACGFASDAPVDLTLFDASGGALPLYGKPIVDGTWAYNAASTPYYDRGRYMICNLAPILVLDAGGNFGDDEPDGRCQVLFCNPIIIGVRDTAGITYPEGGGDEVDSPFIGASVAMRGYELLLRDSENPSGVYGTYAW